MITSKDIFPIGYVAKTHGIKGELNMRLDTDYDPADFRFLVFDIDSINVPFEVTNVRGNGTDNRIISLKGVNDVDDAKMFAGKTAYVLIDELHRHPEYNASEDDGEEAMYLSDLIGFTLTDDNGKILGKIIGFNDDTQNFLLEVELSDRRKEFVPYVDEWVVDLDRDNRTLSLNLPIGLIDQ